MKKKIIISIIGCLILVIGIIGFIFWNNRTVSTITLDINPSIEINLDRNEKIKSIVALNYDAKVLISNDYKSKNIDEVLMEISEKIIDNVDNDGKEYVILLHIDGELSEDKVSEKLVSLFEERHMPVNVIVPKVTKEDEKKAKELGITPAKAAYLSEVVKSNNDLKIEDIKDKSVSELNEMKESGNYCDTGYTLHGDKCYKEINRVAAINGEVCPTGYYKKNEKCYEQKEPVENNNYVCTEGLKLFNDECILENTYDAKGKCDFGDYDNGYCVVKEYIGEGKEYCRITPATDLLYNGRCLGRKPTINGGCINGDKLIGGYCYDTSPNSGYKAEWICPDGSTLSNPDGSLINEDKKCYKETKTKPTSYYCNGNDILNGTKCKNTEIEKAQKEKVCPSGYIMADENSCINYSKVVSKTNGYYCEMDNAILNEKTCIIYEIIGAKSN